jgi:ABC-2 type transport system permease protein
MLYKLWTIARSELYMAFSDRNLILIMLVTPLALATIIGLAFGGISGGGGGDVGIAVALVNHDQPIDLYGRQAAFGQTFEQAMIPPAGTTDEQRAENMLWRLMNTTLVEDAEAARGGVEAGDYAAAVIIPEDFTAKLARLLGAETVPSTTIEVYSSPSSPVSASIVRGVVDSIATQIATGNIAIAATIDALIERAATDPTFAQQFAAESASGAFQPDFSRAFAPQATITVDRQTGAGARAELNLFVLFGTGQAVFFMMFMAMGGANDLRRQQRDGTLNRLLVTPTPRAGILAGKLLGTLIICVAQVLLLLVALTVVSGIVSGRFSLIFGTNLAGIAATILAVALAASGLATLVTSLVRSPEQGDVIGGVISMAMGLFGGAFFNVATLGPLSLLSRLTINYWGVNAFTRLSQGDSAILPNLLVLLAIGAVCFTAGFILFSRRLEA